jgi:hypothetical protein
MFRILAVMLCCAGVALARSAPPLTDGSHRAPRHGATGRPKSGWKIAQPLPVGGAEHLVAEDLIGELARAGFAEQLGVFAEKRARVLVAPNDSRLMGWFGDAGGCLVSVCSDYAANRDKILRCGS